MRICPRGARQFSGSGKDGCIKSSPQLPVGADWLTPILFQGLIPSPSQRIRSTYELVLLFVFRSDDVLWFAFQPLEVPRCLHEGRQRDETFVGGCCSDFWVIHCCCWHRSAGSFPAPNFTEFFHSVGFAKIPTSKASLWEPFQVWEHQRGPLKVFGRLR